MEITNAQYYISEMVGEITAINCIIDGENCSVPIQVGNRHYNEIMRQVDAGTLTIAEAE